MVADHKKKKKRKTSVKKGTRPPAFVKIKESDQSTRLHFPVAAHPIEKRLMMFYFFVALVGFCVYGYLKPDTALLTQGIIPYQLAAFFAGCFASLKFTSLVMSRFYIRLGKITIDMYYGPLARRKLQRLHSERIDQIYVQQVENLFGYRYYVKALTKRGKEHHVYATYHSRLAKYIEYTLENYLGIINRPVSGEFQGIRPSESEEYL